MRRATTTTGTSAARSCRVISSPMPLDAPVTNADSNGNFGVRRVDQVARMLTVSFETSTKPPASWNSRTVPSARYTRV